MVAQKCPYYPSGLQIPLLHYCQTNFNRAAKLGFGNAESSALGTEYREIQLVTATFSLFYSSLPSFSAVVNAKNGANAGVVQSPVRPSFFLSRSLQLYGKKGSHDRNFVVVVKVSSFGPRTSTDQISRLFRTGLRRTWSESNDKRRFSEAILDRPSHLHDLKKKMAC